MSVATKRASGVWIEGMDQCVRGLGRALELAREWKTEDTVLAAIEAEVEAITEHWESVRGPMPPEPVE